MDIHTHTHTHTLIYSCCLVPKSHPILGIPCTVAHQAPLSLGLPRQDYWSGLTFPSPGGLTNPGIKPESPASAGGFFTTEPSGNMYV